MKKVGLFLGGVACLLFVKQVSAVARQEIQNIQAQNQENRVLAANKKSAALEKHCGIVTDSLLKLLTKIEERTNIKSIAGKDVSMVMTSLTEAKSDVKTATDDCQLAVSKFDAIPDDKWTVQKPAITEARVSANKSRVEFVKARLSIVKAWTELVKIKLDEPAK